MLYSSSMRSMINKTHVSTVSMSSNQTASQCIPPSRYFQMAILGQKSSTLNKKAGNPTKNGWFHILKLPSWLETDAPDFSLRGANQREECLATGNERPT